MSNEVRANYGGTTGEARRKQGGAIVEQRMNRGEITVEPRVKPEKMKPWGSHERRGNSEKE